MGCAITLDENGKPASFISKKVPDHYLLVVLFGNFQKYG